MLKFSKLTEYQLLELQHDLNSILIIKKNDYTKDLDDEHIGIMHVMFTLAAPRLMCACFVYYFAYSLF
jgi:hypothetical protein